MTKRAAGADITLAVISAEDETPYFGENCILSAQIDSAAGATVSTCERSHLLVVYLESAADFLRALPEFGSSLLERKAMLRRTNKRLVEASYIKGHANSRQVWTGVTRVQIPQGFHRRRSTYYITA